MTSTRTSAAAHQAWGYVVDLMLSDISHEHMHAACESLDLTPGAVKALLSFDSAAPTPMKTLAHQWRCDASYVTSLVDALEERGMVERRGDPTDRRAKLISITAEGQRTRQLLLDRLHEPPEAVFALTTVEQRTLSELLRKIVEAQGSPYALTRLAIRWRPQTGQK